MCNSEVVGRENMIFNDASVGIKGKGKTFGGGNLDPQV
jgi:hypothetical protein